MINPPYNSLRSYNIWWHIKGSRQERDLVDTSILQTNLMQKHLFSPSINIPEGQCAEEHPLGISALRSGRRKATSFLEVPHLCGWPLLPPSWIEMSHSWFTKVLFMNFCSWVSAASSVSLSLVSRSQPPNPGSSPLSSNFPLPHASLPPTLPQENLSHHQAHLSQVQWGSGRPMPTLFLLGSATFSIK